MSSHELGRLLLAGPDCPVVVNMGKNELANGRELRRAELLAVLMTKSGQYRPADGWQPFDDGADEWQGNAVLVES